MDRATPDGFGLWYGGRLGKHGQGKDGQGEDEPLHDPVVGMWKPADTASRAGHLVVIALVRV